MKYIIICFALCLTAGLKAEAQQLVWQPKHPAFGGNPIHYQWILSSAQAQKDEDESSHARDPLSDFDQNVQRQILNQLSREIVQQRFSDIDFTEEGRHDLGEYIVEVIPGGGGTNIIVTDPGTGDQTTIQIPNY